MKRWAVWGLAILFGAGLAAMPPPAAAELKVKVSGYIKGEVQFDDKLAGSFPSKGPGSTPLDPTPSKQTAAQLANARVRDNSQTLLDVRQSRFRITFTDEVMGVKTQGRIELDFFTGDSNARVSNSRHPRIRHAFAQFTHPSGISVLAGQTWSLSFNLVAAAPVVDFNGPAGQMFNRGPQFRLGWKGPAGGGTLNVEAAVEKQANNATAGVGISEAQGEGQDIPLFGGKITWRGKPFSIEGYGGVTNNKVILANGNDAEETATLFQVSASTTFNPITLFAHYQNVDGLGRIANSDFGDAFLVGNDVRNVESDGFYVGATLKATKATSFNAIFGFNEADEDRTAGFTGQSLEEHRSIHVNVQHNFYKRWRAAVEYKRFDVEAFDGTDGDINTVIGALYFFF